MLKKYGITPWGEKFIAAINRFDMSGRLARGKTYANKGSVRSLECSGHKISAKVAGNYRNYYDIQINFEPFSQPQKEQIYRIIEDHPLILADILNKRLPEELDSLLKEKDIFLMPRSWREMQRGCSCPDWGDPCKHMAAVYYLLTSEIDKNPFAIFEIRDVDLISYFSISEQMFAIEHPLNIENATGNEKQISENIELLALEDYAPFIVSLLGNAPPFCSVNYREAIEQFYKKSARSVSRIIYPRNHPHNAAAERILSQADIVLRGDERLATSVFEISSLVFKEDPSAYTFFEGVAYTKIAYGLELDAIELAKLFISFESASGSQEYRFLYHLFRVFYLLLESSGFVPAVLPADKTNFIVYKPLQAVPEISKQVVELTRLAAPMVRYNKNYLSPRSSTEFILATVLTRYVRELGFMHSAQKNNPPQISQSFFAGEAIDSSRFETREIPASVAVWLSVFDISGSTYSYSVYIEPNRKSYQIGIKVVRDGKEHDLKDAIRIFDKISILKFLSLLRAYLPELSKLLEQSRVPTSRDRLEEFILKTAFVLSNLGVNVVLPKELKNILTPRPVVTAKSSASSFKSFLSLDTLLDYEWKIAIGDKLISVEEFNKMLTKGHELVQFKDQFVRISPEEAKKMFSDLKSKETLSSFDIIKANLNNELLADRQMLASLNGLFKAEAYGVPNTLNASLRGYQERGFQWAVNNLKNGFGVILADDMGLGKTIQAITIILHMKQEGLLKGKVIVVAPTTLLSNWEREFEKFAPSLSFFSYHGAKRELKQDAEIVITTYALAMRDADILKKEKFDCMIIDEAQYIKNPDAKTTKAIKSYKTKYKIALSGTPVENNLSELWSIFDFSIPKYLDTLRQFRINYAKDIEIRHDRQKVETLKTITAPFMLRRLKTDKTVISDLPDKIVIDEFATLSKEQAALYQSVIDTSIKQIETLDGIERKGLIFKLITSLKQICNHPRNYDGTSEADPGLSGKSELLLTLLESMLQKQEKVLIFTQYTKMGEILQEIIEKNLHTVPLYLRGSMSRKKREEAVDLFQETDKHSIFLLSLKAGGTGLNLTAASNVIHYDLWFNPAVENQATDRAFRIGQNKNVFVHRFITKNSFEEKIDRMIKSKQHLSDLSVSVGEKWLAKMDNDEMRDLFS